MQRAQVVQLVDTAFNARAGRPDRQRITTGVDAITRLKAWCDAMLLEYADHLQAINAPAEIVIAQATRSGSRDAERIMQRSVTANAAPVFADALAAGKVAAGHLDMLTSTLRRLDDNQKAKLLGDSQRLVTIAAVSTPDEFARTLRSEERRLATDDGMDRLRRQQTAVRLTTRTDLDTGMNIFTLTVDPLTGVKLHNKIAAAAEALFHDKTPEHCPHDPIEKQSFLRAHALLTIIDGKGIRLGRPEVVVVVDTTNTDPATGTPTIDWGLPVELPHQILIDLFNGHADIHCLVVRNGAIIYAPGELDLGRSTRLANRAQRRALRALYATCAIPGCATKFDNCTIHHVTWWRNGGHTDLCNLLPLCSKHHHCVHDGGWQLHLAHDRTLTITYPDHTTMTTGPPKRTAA